MTHNTQNANESACATRASSKIIRQWDIEAHVSSMETHDVAIKINEVRIEKGLPPMTLIIVPIVTDSDGKKLSSTEIRSGL